MASVISDVLTPQTAATSGFGDLGPIEDQPLLTPETSTPESPTPAAAKARHPSWSEDRFLYLVFLSVPTAAGQVSPRARQLLARLAPDIQPTEVWEQLNGFSARFSPAQADQLSRLEEVASIEADGPVSLIQPIVADDVLATQNWSDSSVMLPQVLISYGDAPASSGESCPWGVKASWQGSDISQYGNIGLGSYAFVIDSGVQKTTNDLNLNAAWSRSWINGQDAFTDGNGHGTHVSGIIAAMANGIGVVGVAPGAEIVSLKVFDDTGSGSISSVIAAVNYAASVITSNTLDLGKVVINMSLGGGGDASLDAAVRNAASLGIRFAIAAGNSAADVDNYSPARAGDDPNVWTVSAVDSTYTTASFSNYDKITSSDLIDNVDVAGPGVNVLSYYKNGVLTNLSGTSMAAPHIAGELLAGGVIKGDLVKPSANGDADPFAWAAILPPSVPTAPLAKYNISMPTTVNEGQALTVTVSSTNVDVGSSLYWRLNGVGIATTDFVGLTSLDGVSTIQADGTANLAFTLAADSLTEGNDILGIQIYSDPGRTLPLLSRVCSINDTSTAPVTNLVLWGTTGNDSITGGNGDDRLTGVTATGTTATGTGAAQIDTLTGGSGIDTFQLGDASRGVYYDDKINNNLGSNDYALITDFKSGQDKLQLRSGSYFVTVSGTTTSLYWDRNANNVFNKTGNDRDELIAVLSNASLSASDLIWV
jgi:hypothetical protein